MSVFDATANLAQALVTVPPAPPAGGLSLTVDDASVFPATPFNAIAVPPGVCATLANSEIIRVTNTVGNVLTILRAQEGTTAQAIAAGWSIVNTPTAATFDEIYAAINGIEANAVIINPATSARNVVQPTGLAIIPLTLKGFAGQTADLLQFQDSAATVLMAVDEHGYLTGGASLGIGIAPIDLSPTAVVPVTEPDWLGLNFLKLAEAVRARMTAAPMPGNDFSTQFIGADICAQGPASAFDHGNVYGIRSIGEFRGTKALNGAAQTNAVMGVSAEAYDWDYTATGNDATGTLTDLCALQGNVLHSGKNRVVGITGLRGFAQAYTNGLIGVLPGQVTGNITALSGQLYVDDSIASIVGYYGLRVSRTAGTTTMTQAAGVRIDNFGCTNAGISAGLRIEAQSGGALPYSIYSLGGASILHAGLAATVPLTLKAAAAQSANLFNLLSSADVLLTAFSETGVLEFGSTGDTNLYRSAADVLKTDDSFLVGATLEQDGTLLGLLGAAPVAQQAASTLTALWTALKNYGLLTAGSVVPGDITDAVILTPTTDVRNVIQPSAATVTPLTIKGFTAQADNLLEFRDSASALLADITAGGVLQFGAAADVNVYRSGADELKTDDTLAVALDLKVVGKTKIAAQADLTINGTTLDMTAGEILAFGDPVYVKNDGKAWKADANGTGTFPAIGIAGAAAAANASVPILVHGVARDDAGWNWTVGGIIYLSTSAGLTQTQPSATNDVIQVLGVALTADVMYVAPDLFYITHV